MKGTCLDCHKSGRGVREGMKADPGREAEDPMKECILLAACGANEMLPQNPDLPADVFTACLTTPIKACCFLSSREGFARMSCPNVRR